MPTVRTSLLRPDQITMKTINIDEIPSFDDLPLMNGQRCAWGLFDDGNEKDILGCLNLLTPDVVKEALKEARDGVSVSLNWPLDAIKKSPYGRKCLVHKILDFANGPFGFCGYDDEVSFNTQCSSQWDSLVHYAHQPTGKAYNGFSPKCADLHDGHDGEGNMTQLPTLNHWHGRGGLVGRGVLIDYAAWAAEKGLIYDPCDSHTITISDIEKVAAWENVQFSKGDIFILRSGYTEKVGAAPSEEQYTMLKTCKSCGVENTVEAVRWFWNHHFCAVASDTMGFERIPAFREDGTDASHDELGKYHFPSRYTDSLIIIPSDSSVFPFSFGNPYWRAVGPRCFV